MARRAPVETAPAFSESDAEAILVRLHGAVAAGVSELGPILTAITETARILTGAGGAAVALRCDGMVTCKARSGEPAPEVGVYLDEESGISGQCLRTGEIMRCEDTLTDFRVNPVVCRTLGLRSIAIVPIRQGEEVFGILEAFSTRPRAFTELHISFLSRLAELAGTAQEQEQSRVDLGKRVRMELHEKTTEPVAVEAEESVLPSMATAPAEPARNYDSMVNRLRDQLYQGRTLGKLYEPAKRRIPILAAVAALLAAGVGWMLFGGSASGTASHSSHHTVAAQQQAAPAEASTEAPETAEITLRPSPARPIERASRRSRDVRSQDEDKATAKDVVKRADNLAAPAESSADAPDTSLVPAGDSTGDQPRAQPVYTKVKNEPAKIEAAKTEPAKGEPAKIEMAKLEPAKLEPSQPESAKVESVKIGMPADGAVLGNVLVARTTVPKLGAPVSAGVTPAVLERQIQPDYPRFARDQKMEGAVVLEATIADTGRVQSVRVISGRSVLAQAAVDAVKQWRYRPTLLDGKPVSTQTQITINFKAPR